MLVLRLLGCLFLGIGAIGIYLPVLPTTIFWILAAYCFTRSSPALRDWIYRRPVIGPQIQTFIERGSLSRSAKRAALIGMGLAGLISGLTLRAFPIGLIAALGLLGLGAVFVLTRREA